MSRPTWQPGAERPRRRSRDVLAGQDRATVRRALPGAPLVHTCGQRVWTCRHASSAITTSATNRERNAIGSQSTKACSDNQRSREVHVERPRGGVDRRRTTPARPAHRIGLVLDVLRTSCRSSPTVITALVVQVPSTLARDRILTRYLALVTDAMEELGDGGRRFDVADRTRRAGRRPIDVERALGRPVGVQRRQRQRPELDRRILERRRARRRRPEPALHVRHVRQGRVEPVRHWRPRSASPRRRRGPTTRCSSTARPVSARPTCCTPSATTCTTTTSTTRCATSRPRRS